MTEIVFLGGQLAHTSKRICHYWELN